MLLLKYCVLISVHCSLIKGGFYSIKTNGKVKYKDLIGSTNSPSLVSCTLHCYSIDKDASVVFEGDNCSCVQRSFTEKENDKEMTIQGTFLEGLGRREIMPVNDIDEQTFSTTPSTKRFVIIDDKEIEIKRSQLITTIPKLTKEYILNFDMKPTNWQDDTFYNVLHMTIKDSSRKYGMRTPGVWFQGSTLTIKSAVNSVQAGYGFTFPLADKLNQWINVKIRQVKESSQYRYSIDIDGTTVHSVINADPAEFTNVKCYVSGAWHKPQEGFVKNVWLTFP